MEMDVPGTGVPPKGPAEAERLPGPLAVGSGRTLVRLALIPQGEDLLLQVAGGRAHIGAVALCHRSESGRLTTEVLRAGRHREGPLAAECAALIAEAARVTCAVAVGIHQDGATTEEIAAIVENVREGARRLARGLANRPDASA